MRAITHCDILTAARAVRHLPVDPRRDEVLRFLDRAHSADRFRKRTGMTHPFWGNGSLSGAVMQRTAPTSEPFLSDRGYLETLA